MDRSTDVPKLVGPIDSLFLFWHCSYTTLKKQNFILNLEKTRQNFVTNSRKPPENFLPVYLSGYLDWELFASVSKAGNIPTNRRGIHVFEPPTPT